MPGFPPRAPIPCSHFCSAMVIPVNIINTIGMSSTGALGVSFPWMPCLVDRYIPLLPLGKRQQSPPLLFCFFLEMMMNC